MNLRTPRFLERGAAERPAALDEVVPRVEGLWLLGADLRSLGPFVSIIGAREASAYGLEVARGLAGDLAARGVCIVSGMARGCDTAAHEGALDAGGTTVAVLATGVDRAYPARNARLYERILERGAIVSERPLGASAHRNHFVERNRIIAALGAGLVVVQGRGARSGASTTVSFATGVGRTVFAVPGDVRSALSTLPHDLIRDGATLCRGAGDIIAELGSALGSIAPSEGPPGHLPGLAPEDASMMAALADGPASTDVLARRAGLDVRDALVSLSTLELAGLALRAGGVYRRRGQGDGN